MMDRKTMKEAEEAAMRHLMQDLEVATRRQNRILAAFLVVLLVWSLVGAGILVKLDGMQFVTNLM